MATKNAKEKWREFPQSWVLIVRRYLPCLALCSLLWELAQLPLYAIWAEAGPARIAYSVVHCTAGDVLIGVTALLIALSIAHAGDPANWPVLLAVVYTSVSERLNLYRGSWAYSPWMPVLPWLHVGLAPVMQWVLVPAAAVWWATRQRRNPFR